MAKTYTLPQPAHLICIDSKDFGKGTFSCQWIAEPVSLVIDNIEPLPYNAPIKRVRVDPRAMHLPKSKDGMMATSGDEGNGIGLYLKKGSVCTLSDNRDELSCKPPAKKK
jgi:hypothetical protein